MQTNWLKWHAKYETIIFSRKISGAKEVVWPGGGDYGRLSVRPGWDWSKCIDKESSPTYLDSCETLFLMYVWCLKFSFVFGIFFKRCIVGWRGTTTTRRTEETTLRWPSCTLNAATSGLRWEKTMGMWFYRVNLVFTFEINLTPGLTFNNHHNLVSDLKFDWGQTCTKGAFVLHKQGKVD